MVQGGGFADVGEDGALDDDTALQGLAEEPGEVDGGVHADACEGGAGVAV